MSHIPVVVDAEYVSGYTVRLWFDNGIEKTVDCAKWLKGELFEPLKDTAYFQKFFLDGWTIAWPNGADIAPETLYED